MESKLENSLSNISSKLKKFRLGEDIQTYAGKFQDFFEPPSLVITCDNKPEQHEAILSFINQELLSFGINSKVYMCYCESVESRKKYKFSINYSRELKLEEKQDLTFKILQKIPRIIENYFIKNKNL